MQITPPANLESVVLNTAERIIVANEGATTDQIYEAVIPELIETGNLPEATKRLKTLLPLLEKHFDRDDINDRWYIKRGAAIGDYIPRRQRIRYYIQSVLNKKKKATIDEIHSEVIPNLANGTTPTNPEFMEVLEGVALSDDGKYWHLKPKSQMPPEQLEMELHPTTGRLRRIPGGARSHTEIIYRLATMGREGGFDIWIGKREQNETFMGEELAKLSVGSFPLQQLSEEQKNKLPWIDVIWFYKNVPVVAFEVEEHTNIRDALERFSFLLEVNPRNVQIVLIIPERRARKLKLELTQSRYVGHPLYMDRKVKYLFYKDLISEYERIRKTHDTVTVSSILRIVRNPQELR